MRLTAVLFPLALAGIARTQTIDEVSAQIKAHALEIVRLSQLVTSGSYPAAAVAAAAEARKNAEAIAGSADSMDAVSAPTSPSSTTPTTGRTLTVPAGGDLQAAIQNAVPGDTIVLQAGAVYVGNFTLPAKNGTGVITIRSSAIDKLPAGTRVTPASAVHMAKLSTFNDVPALRTLDNAHDYRLIGLEVTVNPGVFTYELIRLNATTLTDLSKYPRNIELDRMYIHGDGVNGLKRGISLNSINTVVKNSYLTDFKGKGQETYAISGWLGPGPYRLENNYIAASGINVMFGGEAPKIKGLIPSGIQILRNHFHKPIAWRGLWQAKNLLELKAAQRVTISGNVFENSWADAQSGFAVVLTVRTCTASGDISWNVIKDVTMTNNIIRNAAGGINLLGRDDARGECVFDGSGLVVSSGTTLTGSNTAFTSQLKAGDWVWAGPRTGAGTVVTAANSVTINGNGTAFTAQLQPGDVVYIGGVKRTVRTIVSNTQMIVNAPMMASASSRFEYSSRAKVSAVINANSAQLAAPFKSPVTSLLAFRYNSPYAGETSHITIRNNLMHDISTAFSAGSNAPFLQVLDSVPNLTVEHTTMVGEKKWLTFGPYGVAPKSTNMVIRNNLIAAPPMHGDNMGQGSATFDYYTPGIVFTHNGLAGSHTVSAYPANNFFLPSPDQAGFVNSAADSYGLAPSSPWKGKSTGGVDLGVNMEALLSATAGVVK